LPARRGKLDSLPGRFAVLGAWHVVSRQGAVADRVREYE
jgi:hypothetical protein